MAFRTPLWTQGKAHDAEVLRQLTGVLLTDGVGGGADLAVIPRGAGVNMSVDVSAGRVVVDDYVCWSDATVNLAIGAPPAPGQSRIDSVQAIVTDDNSGTGAWAVTVVAGTSSASPSPPAVPSNGVELARVTTTSSTTSIGSGNIKDRRPSAVRAPYRTSLPAHGTDGQVVTLPGGSLAVRSAGAWIVHESPDSWPKIYRETITGPDLKSPGSGALRSRNLPTDRPLKVDAVLTGWHASATGTSLVTVYLRITGTGITTIDGEYNRILSTNAADGTRTFATSLLTSVPACPNPVITARYDVGGNSANFYGVTLKTMVFPG